MSILSDELILPAYSGKTLAEIEQIINEPTISTPNVGTFITELGILSLLGATEGDLFLTQLENHASQMPVLNRVIRWLRTEKGIDIGNTEVQMVLLFLAQSQIVSSQSATTLIGVGTKLISRAEQLGLSYVGRGDLINNQV